MISKWSIAITVTALGIRGIPPSHMSQDTFETTLVKPPMSVYRAHDETHIEDFLYRHAKEHSQAVVSSRTILSIDVSDTVISTDSAQLTST
jgi:hypothetical protein